MLNKVARASRKLGFASIGAGLILASTVGTAAASVTYQNAGGAGKDSTSAYGYMALNSSGGNGDKIVEYKYASGDQTEQWNYANGSGNSGQIHNLTSAYSGRCLEDKGDGSGNVDVWDCNSGANQKWIDWDKGTYGNKGAWWVENVQTQNDLTASSQAVGLSSNNVTLHTANQDPAGNDWMYYY